MGVVVDRVFAWNPKPCCVGLGCLIALSAAGCGLRSIDLNDKSEYTHIRAFDGHLNPVDGLVHVDVYALDHRPGGDFDRPITQNIIEVTSAAGIRRYRWPEPFAAGWCEIVDLDGDGWREFAFINLTRARVVSFRQGSFLHRTDRDQLIANEPIRLLDKNNDGRLEFITFGPAILDPAAPMGTMSTYNWEKEKGFVR